MSGRITDWPTYTERGLMVDVGRRHFTPGWLEGKIRELAWLKLNVLHLHLSDGLGFRIESASHPEIVTRPALTKDEVRHLVSVADRYHVTVVPEIDSPGHMEAVLRAHPELQLIRVDGTRDPGKLDYSKPAARRLMQDLIAEYADLSPARGSTSVATSTSGTRGIRTSVSDRALSLRRPWWAAGGSPAAGLVRSRVGKDGCW
ncbi:family 20 glycosylhydrolase [Streptomyces sp. NBC_01320]|uniref:family 20 glycosylhydrolase n=1 Tax=Streptomyces sp. NBC_01320 TaxID=2903824 RepID=UPI002E10F348|nr:family 20 glycosylhydrolase [Streptomyces sp. NBC_01320]